MATDTESTAEEAAAPAAPLVPLSLRRGLRIRLGYRGGRVECVRGGGAKPYDFMVKWDDSKYPQWLQYTAAERDYERGHLKIDAGVH